MLPELATIIGVIVGAVIGGGFSYWITNRQIKLGIEKEKRQRLEDKMLAMFKNIKVAFLAVDSAKRIKSQCYKIK
ncbi:hypothetical protein KKB41_04225 [Patescibacteria group bacterium]|nr:hypothetical protein [Patescibacteria group bacterium]